MTFVGTIHFFFYRIMRYTGYIGMAVPAGNISVDSVRVYIFINIVNFFASLFVDPTDLTVLMSH